MLTTIRERAKGLIIWFVILAIAIPLVVTGIYSYIAGPQGTEVATVDGVPISAEAVNSAYQQQRARLAQMFGGQLDPSLFDDRLLRREALDRLINETVLRRYVEEQGLRISDATLADIIFAQDVFHEDGRFSRERYLTLLRANGLTPQGYEARVRLAEAIEQLRTGIQGSDFATADEVRQIASLQGQERELAYLTVDAEAFRDQVSVSDEEVRTYYQANSSAFQEPEQVKLAYVELGPEQVASQIEIDDNALKARYEQEKARFTEGGERRVRHILLALDAKASQEQVEEARQRLLQWREQVARGEADFAELAKQHSQDPGSAASGGDLGFVRAGDMVPEFEQAAFALEPGQLSEPVRTQYGLHLIQVTERTPEQVTPYEQVREQLRQELVQERSAKLLAELSNRLANLAYEHPDTLEPAVKDLGVELKTNDWVGAQGQQSGIAAEEAVRAAAFSDEVLREGRNSQLLSLSGDRYVVVRVAEHKPAVTKPLEEVAADIGERLRREKQAERAKQLAEELRGRVAAGEALDALAGTQGVTVTNPGFVTRDAEAVPAAVLQEAFRLRKPTEGQASVATVALQNGSVAVLKVSAVREGKVDDEAGKQQAEWIGPQLRSLQGAATMNAFLRALRDEAKVKIREDRL